MFRQSLNPTLAATAALLACLAASPARARSTESTDRPAGPCPRCPATWSCRSSSRTDVDATRDFRRFVLLFTHRFSERIRFVGELEVEHAVVEGCDEKGELEVEQAYLDFLIDRRFNVRAGQMLAPIGLINERHEPPVFYGVQRPFVDTFIIPTTWFDIGAGVFGEFGRGWRYRAYAMAPLDATEFSADEGLAESPQTGSRAVVRHCAGTARVEYLGIRRLALGASIWSAGARRRTRLLDPRVTVAEVDGRGQIGRFELRGEFAKVFIPDAGQLNQLRRLREGIDPNVASQMLGAYVEVAHRLLPFPSPREVVGFARYERFDTQHRMPAGYLPLTAVQPLGVGGRRVVLSRPRRRREGRLYGRANRQFGRQAAAASSTSGSVGGSESEVTHAQMDDRVDGHWRRCALWRRRSPGSRCGRCALRTRR